MKPDPSKPSPPSQPPSPRSASKKHLPLILAALGIIAVLWVVLRILTRSPNLTTEGRLFLLLIAALLSLGTSLGGLTLILNHRGRSLQEVVSIPVILALAYAVPILAFVLPDWINPNLAAQDALLAESSRATALLAAGQPWFYLWQALVLAGSTLIHRQKQQSPSSPTTGILWRVVASLLAGLAAWLAATFVFGLFSNAFPLEPEPPSPILQAALLTVSVLIAPWTEEHFFRGELLNRWEKSLGRTRAVLASAALFATLQMRPLLWLPAFIAGLVLAELALNTRRLTSPMLAHALCNLLFYLIGWYLVI